MADENGIVARWKSILQASTDTRLSRGDLAVMIGILDRMDGSGKAWPGLTRIATDARVDRSTAIRGVRRLCEFGYLSRESGSRTKSNEYRIGPAGRCEAAPTGRGETAPSGRCEAAPRVDAPVPPQVGAGMPLEPALKNLPIEPSQLKEVQKHSRFDEFWTLYPRKDAKAKAASAWIAKKLDASADKIIADIKARLSAGVWTEVQFVPHATTYLNGCRWEDEWSPPTPRFSLSLADQMRQGGRHRESLVERATRKAREQIAAIDAADVAGRPGSAADSFQDNFIEGEFTSLKTHPARNPQ